MSSLFTADCYNLLTNIKLYVLSGPVLAHPDPRQHFYVQTNCIKFGMGAVLLQADDFEDSRAAESKKHAGGGCLFNKTIKVLRPCPVAFISHKTKTVLSDHPINTWARLAPSDGISESSAKTCMGWSSPC